jgi:hypothetical protein
VSELVRGDSVKVTETVGGRKVTVYGTFVREVNGIREIEFDRKAWQDLQVQGPWRFDATLKFNTRTADIVKVSE